MKSWEVKDGVLRVVEKEHWGDVAFNLIFGLLVGVGFGGAGLSLLRSIVADAGKTPWWPILSLLSLPFIALGAWIFYETLMPWHSVEVARMNGRWTVVSTRAFRLFRRCHFLKTKHPEGTPGVAAIRRAGGMGGSGHYICRVRLDGTGIVDFKSHETAAAVCEALRNLTKDSGPWTER